MPRCTWSDGRGNWGIRGVDLATLPPNAYGALYKLHNIERLADEIQTASNRPGYDYDYLIQELLDTCGVRHAKS